MSILVYGRKRQVVGYCQCPDNGAYMRILLDGGQVYVFAAANTNQHYAKMLVEPPSEVREAPDGNGDILTFADGTQARTGGVVMPFTKTDAEYMTAMRQADAAPANSKPERKPRTEWTLQAQEKVAAIWVEWRRGHNTKERGGREIDCFEKHKATLPECIKTAKDFHDCRECSRKHGLIPKHNRKRRKSAG